MTRKDDFSGIGNGNMDAFEALVSAYNEPLNAFAYRMLNDREAARDIVQDVFVKVWSNRRKIDFCSPVGGYLYNATRNASINYMHVLGRFDGEVDAKIPSEELTDVFMIEEEVNRMIAEAIERLPERTAQVIRLSMEGIKQEDIAERMNVTVSNVKNLKTLGIKKLKKMLGPLGVLITIC